MSSSGLKTDMTSDHISLALVTRMVGGRHIRDANLSAPGIDLKSDKQRLGQEGSKHIYSLPVLPETPKLYQSWLTGANRTTTHRTAACSSFSGVQCVANFSLPLFPTERRVARLMSADTARPAFNAIFTRFLKSRGMFGEY